jgi:regulator of protease activity HflC (stomatin/prohibitin superfamily)
MRRVPLLGAIGALALAPAGCGESTEDRALVEVCDARADITRQIDELAQLTPTTVTADAVTQNVEAIRGDLRTITEAQGELSDDRREEARAANDAFAAEVRSVASTLLRSTSVEEAEAQLGTAVDQLAESYRSTLGTVDCD